MSRSGRAVAAPPAPMLTSQVSFTLPAYPRGCHLITRDVRAAIAQYIAWCQVGVLHLFIQHTSASLTINENADPTVREDMEMWMNETIKEETNWKHDYEGSDDMPAHVKSSVFGCSVTVPITGGSLNLGTWQGIWLGEHRDEGGARRIVATIQGSAAPASSS